MSIHRMSPNLMGRSTGFQVATLGPDDIEWVERGEYADYNQGDAWPHAQGSMRTWERRGHKVRIYQIDRRAGTVVYETK